MEKDRYIELLEAVEEALIKQKFKAEATSEICEVILEALKKDIEAAENTIKNSGKPQNIERR